MAGSVKEFTDGNWKSEVLDSPIPVVVDFWAPWCGPCRMLAPTIEKLAGEYDGKVKVGKMNTDENKETPGSLRISAIPTVLFFHKGEEVRDSAWSASIPRPSSRRRWTSWSLPDRTGARSDPWITAAGRGGIVRHPAGGPPIASERPSRVASRESW